MQYCRSDRETAGRRTHFLNQAGDSRRQNRPESFKTFRGLFHGNDIIIDRLASGEDHNFRIRAGGLEELPGLLSVFLLDVFTGVQGDKGGVPAGSVCRQLLQKDVEGPVGAEELSLFQGQVISLLDVEAVKIGIPGGVGNLSRSDTGEASVIASAILWASGASKSTFIIAVIPWGTVLVGMTTTFFSVSAAHCWAAMIIFPLLGSTNTVSAGI